MKRTRRARLTEAALGAAAVVLAFEAAACGGQLDVVGAEEAAGAATSGGASGSGGSGGTAGGAGGGSVTTAGGASSSSDGGGSGGANASCVNEAIDGDETDVDCGGDACPPCSVGDSCEDHSHCLDRVCDDDGICTPPACDDAVLNGDETDIDCGGSCVPCLDGAHCQEGDNCESGVCDEGVCRDARCDDGVRNGRETGIDCGEDCEPCVGACDCAVSERLSVLNCGSTTPQDLRWPTPSLLSADGSVLAFTRCVLPEPGVSCEEWEVMRQADGQTLESLGWGISEAMSPDGLYLVLEDFEGDGIQLRTPDGSEWIEFWGRAAAISDDGEVLALTSYPDDQAKAVRWIRGTGFEELGDIPDGTGVSHAVDMSADGMVIVGYAQRGTDEVPFIWRAGVLEALTALPGDANTARPLQVSDDGSTMVGVTGDLSSGEFFPVDLFRWTEAEGFSVIAPVCRQSCPEQLTLRVSHDGSVIAGTYGRDSVDSVDGAGVAFRWTESEGVVRLMNTEEPYLSNVHDMSTDGRVIVGRTDATSLTYVWEETLGMIDLGGLLALRGVDIGGWEFRDEIQVSADGNVVVGVGSCGGTRALYRAVLSED